MSKPYYDYLDPVVAEAVQKRFIDELEAAKDYWRTHHFQTARLVDGQPHREELARHISQLAPRGGSVLEFGCSSGRNLAVLHQLRPDLKLTGIDMNEVTVQAGRDEHSSIEFVLGNENELRGMPHYDVVFTCSVLDHIPHPQWRQVYDDMVLTAKVAVVLLEPVLFEVHGFLSNGKPAELVGYHLECDFADPELGIAATPFSYAHSYYSHDRQLHGIRHLPITNAGQWQDFANCYWLMERRIT